MKEKFFKKIIEHRVLLIIVFLICAVCGLVCKQLVAVNYDMNDYLPQSAPSSEALDVMNEEFSGGIPGARVMVKGVSIEEALEYKSKIADVSGVEEVTWLDDAVSLSEPLETQNKSTVENYYKDNNALFTVTMNEDDRIEVCSEIRSIIGDENCMTGSDVSTAVATTSTVSEVFIITIICILLSLLILIITTKSWLEPLIILLGLGVAVAINGGSNLVFGEISFVTNAAGIILQFAISLDFSVFLIHRLEEERGQNKSIEKDVVASLSKSFTAIISSACTVTIGFLALTVMQFQIGPDLGFALAKGMVISLICVFLFLPCMLVVCNKWIVKTAHRPFVPNMQKLGAIVFKACVPLACIFLLIITPAYLASKSDSIEYYYGASHIFSEGTQYGTDTAEIEETFGQSDTYVVLVPNGNLAKEKQLSCELKEIDRITSLISYVDSADISIPTAMVEKSTLNKLQGENYSRFVLTVDAPYEGEATWNLVQDIRDTCQQIYGDNYYLTGQGVSTNDLRDTVIEDKDLVDIIAIAAVFLVLLLAMKSLLIPVILVLVIETTIWINFSLPYFTCAGEFYIAYLIVSTIQLGVTVDYAILLTDRYKEARQKLGPKAAIIDTTKATTIPILTSGSVCVIAGTVLSCVSTHGILAQLGYFLAVGVGFSLFVVIVILPGYLFIFDKFIQKTTLKCRFVNKN